MEGEDRKFPLYNLVFIYDQNVMTKVHCYCVQSRVAFTRVMSNSE